MCQTRRPPSSWKFEKWIETSFRHSIGVLSKMLTFIAITAHKILLTNNQWKGSVLILKKNRQKNKNYTCSPSLTKAFIIKESHTPVAPTPTTDTQNKILAHYFPQTSHLANVPAQYKGGSIFSRVKETQKRHVCASIYSYKRSVWSE